MKSMIVTVAGTATRFNRDTDEDTLKCLYYIDDPRYSLLSLIMDSAPDMDEYIIVGGYLYDKLQEFVERNLNAWRNKIRLIYNPEYRTYGSGYSLILGVEACSHDTDEIIFVEGDLYYNHDVFERIIESKKDVFTVNQELITANKAVVVYETVGGQLRYLYDTGHRSLEIQEPFIAIYNSAQIWKFVSPHRLGEVVTGLSEKQRRGTNLEIIQRYFGGLRPGDYDMVKFDDWFNCNTVADYRNVHSLLKKKS